MVERAPALHDPPLDRSVAAYAQQQRHFGQLLYRDFDRAMHDVSEARRRAAPLRGPLVKHREQRVKRAANAPRQQLFLAANVIVDAGLGDSRSARDIIKRAAVVAALAEYTHRHIEDRVKIVGLALLRGWTAHAFVASSGWAGV